jgi:hypothetical protein
MTCLGPYYLIQYSGEPFYKKIKQGLSLIKGINQNLTILTEDSHAALVIIKKYSECGKVLVDHRIK